MTEDTITIEIDGKPVEARKGQMLIEVTDQNDIYVPRFCYHNKLSVAANCRMCLVEVEKAPKPLPACATPVMDGMVVKTHSPYAMEAQKSVMEFLLINHPLDCPICDQGGECELQDLAVGYGSDVSRYQESKRVVKDKDIGPLIQTDLTRCIHCTRCVRFGEEIAGLRELGATGRGEHMQIGTYVEKSMRSELSGNIIDLCPVGALTSKPFRFSARAWEMQQKPGIAPHDCVGSNVEFHVRNNKVMRVVPAANEEINEVWLSDRDRFSYEGLYSEDRLTRPIQKTDNGWQEIDWEVVLQTVADQLTGIKQASGVEQIAALTSASVSNEEYYLLQKLMRGLGSSNIDHRLNQQDFSSPQLDGFFPWLGQAIQELEQLNSCLMIAADTRREVPIINHRIRKAWLNGCNVMAIDVQQCDYNLDLTTGFIVDEADLPRQIAAVYKSVLQVKGTQPDTDDSNFINTVEVNDSHRQIAENLCQAESALILLGESVQSHPQRALIINLCHRMATASGHRIGFISAGANAAGAWMNGILPHRKAFSNSNSESGLHVKDMLARPLKAYLLYHIEPERDFINSEQLLTALLSADLVVAFSAYRTAELEKVADIILPIALFAENEGSCVNIEGRLQTFEQAVKATGEISHGWRILRLLANACELPDFNYQSVTEIQKEIFPSIQSMLPGHGNSTSLEESRQEDETFSMLKARREMYSIDPLVRRSSALAAVSNTAREKS